MIDNLMDVLVIQSVIAKPRIGEEVRTALNVLGT